MSSIQSFQAIGLFHRRSLSRDLMWASRRNPQLARELPLVARGYEGPPRRIASRMKKIAHAAEAANLFAGVIVMGGFGGGIATAQVNEELPSRLKDEGRAVELSYWHERPQSTQALAIGKDVVSHLRDIAKRPPFSADIMWMVTLPEDRTKQEVLRHAGFLTVEGPQRYDIGDEAVVPRLLWARPANGY